MVNAINVLRNRSLKNTIEDTLNFVYYFKMIKFSFIAKKFNEAVNYLAKFNTDESDCLEWVDNFFVCLREVNFLDARN